MYAAPAARFTMRCGRAIAVSLPTTVSVEKRM
jgi:hypothetical protein